VRGVTAATALGLTWDHPRGHLPLEAAAEGSDLDVQWHRQPLEGFESHPLADLAARYELLVIDHPHVGDAAASGVLQPLGADELEGLPPAVGASTESYRYDGELWALPLDAAAQVGVSRPDRLVGPPPATWAEAVALAARVPTLLPLAGPHAALGLFAIAAAFGDVAGRGPDGALFAGPGAHDAWDVLTALAAACDRRAYDDNPIAVLDELALGGEAAWCPLVYGYVTYATAGDGRRALRFHDAPAATAGGAPGSVLGGTGLALSALRPPSDEVRAHARELAGALQTDLIPATGGQPAASAAWDAAAVDAAAGGFYSGTRRTLEHAMVRPRFAGYVEFQAVAAEAVRDALRAGEPAGPALDTLERLYAVHRPPGAEI
jgi:multiple sugar transport system substrate-binding protein